MTPFWDMVGFNEKKAGMAEVTLVPWLPACKLATIAKRTETRPDDPSRPKMIYMINMKKQ